MIDNQTDINMMTTKQAIETILIIREVGNDDTGSVWNSAFQQLINEDVVWEMSNWWVLRAKELIQKGFCQLPIE
jgi:hypothetical protein